MDRGFVYTAAVFMMVSVPIGTWVACTSFSAIHVFQILVFLLIMTSLALYVLGRREFVKHTEKHKVMSFLLLVFGVFLFFYGGYISYFALRGIEFHAYWSMVPNALPIHATAIWSDLFDLIWSSLWEITGVLFTVDYFRVPAKGVGGAMVAITSFLVFWNTTWFGFPSYFFGRSLYLAVRIGTALLTIAGLAVFAVSLWKRRAHGLNGFR